ncbi:MAG TPA: protein kinase [Gemmatimonadaceae bacterium]|nr:protein kinase [Gemmatimonadaceae bacterium]
MPDELPNSVIAGRYRVSHEIGRGGMATVYRAHDVKHDRDVALKVLSPDLPASLGTERFLREIAFTARLDHPHILPLLDSGESDGLLYYVMPLVEGESLRDRLMREKQLPIDEALQITREIASALSHAHSHGVLHRDIKPENIMLSGGHARVADFGIGRALSATVADNLTVTGLAIGTPIYMSPEQASGATDVDARADVYSLASVLYEMLAGQPPYSAPNTAALLARKSLEPMPPLRTTRGPVPPGVEQAIAKALSRVPADRFASAREFAHALDGKSMTPTASRRLRAPAVAMLALLVLGAIAVVADIGDVRTRVMGSVATDRIATLAVLPLENLSGDTQQDFLAAGMHEALITGLGKLRGLERVTARSSVLRYQKTDRTPPQIGEELNVDAIITGSVTRAGDIVRVTANLMRAQNEEPVWSRAFERELRDVLSLQNEIVAAIAREVQLELSPVEQAGLRRARAVNPAAYQLYLKGWLQMTSFTPEGFENALRLHREAIAIDPNEALAYAGLAEVYGLLEIFRPSASRSDAERARAAALKAIELDPTLAQAHVALGNFRIGKEWDYRGAEASYKRALELNPNHADAHISYAIYQSIFGDQGAAIAEYKRGIELDPFSPLYTAWLAGTYWEFSRPDDAIREAQKALVLQPDFPVALFVLGLSYADKKRFDDAIATHQRGLDLYPTHGFSWTLAATYALAGRKTDARNIMAQLDSGKHTDVAHPWFIAAAYTAMGELDRALDWLERAYEERSLFLCNLGRDRAAGFDIRPLHGHPRYVALLRKVNLAK